jgi:hypothetical protein
MLFIAIGGLLALYIALAMIITIGLQQSSNRRLLTAPTLYPDPLPEAEDVPLET